jgi:hypothetical protein
VQWCGERGEYRWVFSLRSALSVLFQEPSTTFEEEGMIMDCTTWGISFPERRQRFDEKED